MMLNDKRLNVPHSEVGQGACAHPNQFYPVSVMILVSAIWQESEIKRTQTYFRHHC